MLRTAWHDGSDRTRANGRRLVYERPRRPRAGQWARLDVLQEQRLAERLCEPQERGVSLLEDAPCEAVGAVPGSLALACRIPGMLWRVPNVRRAGGWQRAPADGGRRARQEGELRRERVARASVRELSAIAPSAGGYGFAML